MGGIRIFKEYFMPALLIACLLDASIFESLAYDKDKDEWAGEDKALHVAASFIVDTAAYNILRKDADYSDGEARIAAFLVTLFAGFTKELIDDRFSWKDMAADLIGAGAGAGLSIKF